MDNTTENKEKRMKLISDQSFERYGATIYVFDCVMTAAICVDGHLFVMANSKLPRAERTRRSGTLSTDTAAAKDCRCRYNAESN